MTDTVAIALIGSVNVLVTTIAGIILKRHNARDNDALRQDVNRALGPNVATTRPANLDRAIKRDPITDSLPEQPRPDDYGNR